MPPANTNLCQYRPSRSLRLLPMLLLFEDCRCQKIRNTYGSIFGSHPSRQPQSLLRPTRTCERSGMAIWFTVLFQSEFAIELVNSPITLASGTLKSLAVQNPDCTAGVLDHSLGL